MEYLAHINPVAARAVDWDGLSLSAGLARSAIPANTRPHLKAGAQKKIVCGPAGAFQKGISLRGNAASIFPRKRTQSTLATLIFL